MKPGTMQLFVEIYEFSQVFFFVRSIRDVSFLQDSTWIPCHIFVFSVGYLPKTLTKLIFASWMWKKPKNLLEISKNYSGFYMMQIPMPSTKVTKNSRCKGFFFSVSEVLRSWRGGLQSSPTTHLWQGWFLEVPKIYLTRGQVKIDNFVGCCWVEHFFWGSKLKLLKGAEEQQNRGGVFFCHPVLNERQPSSSTSGRWSLQIAKWPCFSLFGSSKTKKDGTS